MFNIGFKEVFNDFYYDCFMFYDVDLFLENDFNIYICFVDYLKYLFVVIDKFNYK